MLIRQTKKVIFKSEVTWTPIKNFGDSDINQLYDTLLKTFVLCYILLLTDFKQKVINTLN